MAERRLGAEDNQFTQAKTERMVQIPIHPDLHEWLRTHRNGPQWVFPTLWDPPCGTTGLSQSFARLGSCKRQGLTEARFQRTCGPRFVVPFTSLHNELNLGQ